MPKGKYRKKKNKPPKTALPPVQPSIREAQESSNNKSTKKEKEKDMPNAPSRSYQWIAKNIMEVLTGLILLTYITSDYFLWKQFGIADTSVRVEQRAWIGFVRPENFPLEGVVSPATLQVTNFGKTPAREVKGDIIATELMKGEYPVFDFSVGHPHNSFYPGAVFPGPPIPVTIPVQRYGAFTSTTISPSELRQDLESQRGYIVFYGQITYKDIFGYSHWTHFCTGSGKAMETGAEDALKKCIEFNDVDHEKQ